MDTNITASTSGNTEAIEHSLQSLQERYMLTQVGQQQLVFPTRWVGEIMLVERSQILKLPFYDRSLLGLMHHGGTIVPLLDAHPLILETLGQDARSRTLKESLTVVRLRSTIDGLAGVGIVVDRVIGSVSSEQITELRLFQRSDIPNHLWQPRW
ncbi:MAG: chemotaxis protein CheW [Stenomitos rutilans HA7619-LM2]|jgi:chemotaxis signal transduction protein|nr:chemotaxis protein CheW [Stenomitos rutilans HA7619-LM2]